MVLLVLAVLTGPLGLEVPQVDTGATVETCSK
jgi:hypothetical protein